jgi:hypothetical protein
MNESTPISRDEYHPVFIHARREAAMIFVVWLIALLWAVPYCYVYGYHVPAGPDELHTVFGVPSWLVYGVFLPWLAADAFTIFFCFFYMQDDDLGEAHEGADLEEEIAEMHAKESQRKGDS